MERAPIGALFLTGVVGSPQLPDEAHFYTMRRHRSGAEATNEAVEALQALATEVRHGLVGGVYLSHFIVMGLTGRSACISGAYMASTRVGGSVNLPAVL